MKNMTQNSDPLSFKSIKVGEIYIVHELCSLIYDNRDEFGWLGFVGNERLNLINEPILVLDKGKYQKQVEILCYSLKRNVKLVIFGLNERLIGDCIKIISE